MTVVRPLKFDRDRKARRNAKRRDARRLLKARRERLMRFFNRIFWFGMEPEIMWDASPWDDRDPLGAATAHNDNCPR